jgi:hypothetical protein
VRTLIKCFDLHTNLSSTTAVVNHPHPHPHPHQSSVVRTGSITMTSGGGGGPSGRSPFPASRHTRRNPQPSYAHNNNTSASSSLAPPDSFLQQPHDGGESSSAHSPFLNNLLRFSPKASISPLNSHHRGGNGVTNAGQQRRTRFFDGGTAHASSAAAHHRRSVDASTGGSSSVDSSGEPPPLTTHHKSSLAMGGGATTSNMTTTLLTDLQDGIPLDHLRRLADQHLLSAPEMAAFYAGIVYAKTSSSSSSSSNNYRINSNITADDGLRLARAHAAAGQYEACLRIMEEADLLSSSSPQRMMTTDDHQNTNYYPWDAIIVAAQALSGKRDWPALIELLEDVCRSCGNTMAVDHNDDPLITPAYGNNNNNNNHQRLLLATTTTTSSSTPVGATANPLEDSDLPGWLALRRSINLKGSSTGALFSGGIHPLAMVCYFRANAYFATGCGFRACTYWKLALQMDCQCQPAWEALQGQKLLSPQEAYELLTRDLEFAHPEQDWLRSFYLARIEVTTTTLDVAAAAANSNTSLSTTTTVPHGEPKSDTDMMASVPELLSPIPSVLSPNAFSTAKRPAATTNRHHHHHHDLHVGGGGEPSSLLSGTNPTTTMIQADVSAAFTNLWDKHKLQDSPQILAMAARRAYRNYDWKKCLEYCHYLSQLDPTLSEAAFCYVSSLVLLGHKRVLFRLAHQWVEAAPKSARAWFAVGAYYYCIERYHVAQRHFSRATRLDPQCSEAWIAFGCSFAACDESDQALASFRAAHRLSPGDHSALTYMGIEYLRTNNSGAYPVVFPLLYSLSSQPFSSPTITFSSSDALFGSGFGGQRRRPLVLARTRRPVSAKGPTGRGGRVVVPPRPHGRLWQGFPRGLRRTMQRPVLGTHLVQPGPLLPTPTYVLRSGTVLPALQRPLSQQPFESVRAGLLPFAHERH